MASSGAGSAGQETTFFGTLTYKALVKFQTAHNLPATGYFGPMTRGVIAILSTAILSTQTNTGTADIATPPSSTPTTTVTCTAPAGLTCFPGTNITQPYAPGNGYTPGFGGGGNVSTPPADTTAPAISAISSGTPTTTSTTIAWTTDEISNSKVVYGLTSSYGSVSTSASFVTLHSVSLTGLTAVTTYHYAVVSSDSAGNTATSGDQTFTTTSTLSSGQLATLSRLTSAAATSLSNNPVDNADMASPPTVTQSASPDGPLTVAADYLHNPSTFFVSSGNKYARTTTNGLYVGTSNWTPNTAGNLSFVTSLSPALVNNGEHELAYTVTFVTNAPVVQLQLRVPTATTPFRIIVNNQFVARDGIANTSQYVKLDFGSSASRTITVEAQAANSFLGVAVGSSFAISAPTDTVVKGVFTGDSITESSSSGDTNFYIYDGWASTFSKQVGINSMRNAAVGGTGYWNTFSGARSNIYDQMNYWVTGDTYDVIGFAGGYNDTGQVSDATITALALSAWQRARAAQPNALILVYGIFGEARGPTAGMIATENALHTTFDVWNDPFSKFIPISTDTNGAWLTGTGYIGNTNGSGNSDMYVSSDGVHPTRVGRIYLGGKANAAYRALLPTLH